MNTSEYEFKLVQIIDKLNIDQDLKLQTYQDISEVIRDLIEGTVQDLINQINGEYECECECPEDCEDCDCNSPCDPNECNCDFDEDEELEN